ncbi:iron ABC transporter permease [Massilia sp. CF038]|uniref:FecCD family ABC transporter permease n=1 Tax=Massilia sp. CF038 TaxID=1881045 RepID=UPI00091EE007|nr:iron ABC transporter permease [Massilia sp. CF038]SHH53381.1 iron complex transport system permease protein [Massilia sp. CF038]
MNRAAYPVLILCTAILMIASMANGAGTPGLADLFALSSGSEAAMIILDLRLPRTLAAVLVGSALGAAGMLMQAVTRNPLAEPGLLGVNSGAALGVVAGIAWAGAAAGPGYLVWALLGALVGNGCVLAVAHVGGSVKGPLRLVLAGIALGATFHGASSAILLSEPAGYDQYRFWVLGSLAGATQTAIAWVAAPILGALIAALMLARPLSALQLGDDSARALGHRPALLRAAVAVVATLLTGSAVALAGPIAFLGLLAPHLARACKPGTLAQQIALSAMLGAALLLLADLGARLFAQPFETPVSVMTAMLGAPLLVWLARRGSL